MATPSTEAKILALLVEAAKKAFSVQFSLPINITSIQPKSTASSTFEVASILGISSSSYQGSIAICFPQKTFLGMVNKMLGENFSEISSENVDAAGEALNIVYGVGRPTINELGNDFAPAIPSVVHGEHVKLNHAPGAQIFSVCCTCDVGPFDIELSLKTKDSKGALAK